MSVTQKIFIVEFGQESRFLFHHTRVTTILSPKHPHVEKRSKMFGKAQILLEKLIQE